MPVTAAEMTKWIPALLGAEPTPWRTLEDYLNVIPRLPTLASLPEGTPVLVRGDVDAKPGKKVGEGDIRLRSMADTLNFGRQHGFKQIIFGHIGREQERSLKAVAQRLGEILVCDVPLIENWYDDSTGAIAADVKRRIDAAAAGSVLMLENTRRYTIERMLWEATPEGAAGLAEPLAKFANECAAKLAQVYVNEAFSAGSLDSSSTIVPAAMQRVALGAYVAEQFDGPMRQCLRTQLVIFSGLKTDKLDDLEAMIGRGTIRKVFTAGSLAMALKKADAELKGTDFSLGLAENRDHSKKPHYIARERIDQAKRMLESGRAKGIEFVLPVDFVLQDGRDSETIGPGDQQFDIGPKTIALFEQKVGEFLDSAKRENGGRPVVFYNGVFGMFEDPRFEEGTRSFMQQLKRMKDAGAEVYIGGGEGGTALEKYGKPDWVTQVFTAGGTVLNALGSQPVPYLVALAMAASKKR